MIAAVAGGARVRVASAPVETPGVTEIHPMAQPERYVFVCINQRPAGHPKGSCLDRGAASVFEALREEQGRRLLTSVKVVATGCMEACLAGPALLVVPDNIWYGGVTEADVPELVERHLVGGEPVEMLRIGPEDFTG
jgi:(2Fe-2S) ferredoxin